MHLITPLTKSICIEYKFKVGRAQTMAQARPTIDKIMTEALNYHRVYVASVHPQVTERDLRDVFEPFGEVVKCQLAMQPMGKAHRYCIRI